ncbi:MAG TPA: vitamin K epoxide reductase family protein [Fimbriimonadaceae bacterium]|nr:vitamin K epoxide reductase family protein [Fimbriimonadaceae bacterium]
MTSGAYARFNVVLSFVGLFIASMLSLSHFMGIELPCGLGNGCDLVTQDPRSQLLGIPFAYYGLFGYAVIAAVCLVRLFAPTFRRRELHAAGYALSLIGLFVSIGLTLFSIRSIHALCTWCIGSAVTMSLLFVSHSLASIRDPNEAIARSPLDGVWVVVLACAVMAGLMSGASDLKTAEATSIPKRETLVELNEEELLPADAHVRGPQSAHATVVMFGDLTCPVCREAYQNVTDLMTRRHDFRFAFRQLPLPFHPLARPAALISEMAAEKGRFWDFATACYANYPDTVDDLIKLAQGVGLDSATVRKRMKDQNDPAALALDRDAKVTEKLDLHSTPSVYILIDGYYPEPITYRGIEEMLDHNTATKK